MELSAEHNRVSGVVVDSALTVHRALGPGLLESAYEECLACELRFRGLALTRQVSLPIVYRDLRIEAGYRLDLVIEDLIVVEIKAVERLLAVHDAQVLTYLKLSGRQLGLLINFNVPVIKLGIKRLVRTE
jgi:GxxExxY protein